MASGSDFGDSSKRAASEPPRTRGRLILRLTLLCILGFTGAVAGGYLWWTERSDHKKDADDKQKAQWAAKTCNDSLGEVTVERDKLNRQVATCESEKGGTEQKKKEIETMMASMEANLQGTRTELEDLRKQRAETEKRLATFKDLTAKLKKMIDNGKIEVKVRNGVMLVALPAEVLFSSGSADLSEGGQMSVLEVGIGLKSLTDRRFMVVGHTDDLPIKSTIYKDNWELSTARATTVTKFLVKAGVLAKNVIAAGHGEHDPVASNKTKEGREKNRRIEIVLMPAIDELPPIPDDIVDAKPEEGAKAPDSK